MATKDKRASILNFDRGEDWVSPAELRLREEEERRIEEENRRRIESAGRPNTRGRYRPLDEQAAEDSEQGILGALVDRIQSGGQRLLSGQLTLAGDSDAAEAAVGFDDVLSSILSGTRGGPAGIYAQQAAIQNLPSQIEQQTQPIRDAAAEQFAASERNERALQPAYNKYMLIVTGKQIGRAHV